VLKRAVNDGTVAAPMLRPVRLVVAGQTCGEPTNVAREGPVGAGAHRVVLESAVHL